MSMRAFVRGSVGRSVGRAVCLCACASVCLSVCLGGILQNLDMLWIGILSKSGIEQVWIEFCSCP